MIRSIIIILGLMILFSGCFTVVSSTIIQINNVNQNEYNNIKQDIKHFIINLNKPMDFDCEFDNKMWKENRENGDLICRSIYLGDIQVYREENMVKVTYSRAPAFFIPTKEIITDEHKIMQGIFLGLGYYFKEKYKKDVKVIFYHRDLRDR